MAEKLARYGLTQRTALLLILLTVLSVSGILMAPKKAEAACCGFDTVIFYYFDAAKTQYAGQCWNNECTGSTGCAGTTPTAYRTTSRVCCDVCHP